MRKAILVNLASASVAILGTALVAGWLHRAHEAITTSLLPITAGGLIYLTAVDLILKLQYDQSLSRLGRAKRVSSNRHCCNELSHAYRMTGPRRALDRLLRSSVN